MDMLLLKTMNINIILSCVSDICECKHLKSKHLILKLIPEIKRHLETRLHYLFIVYIPTYGSSVNEFI